MTVRKTLLALAGATIWLCALAAASSARNLSSSETRLRATFASVEFTGGFGASRCELTLEGSFHARTMPKVLGSLTGFITKAILRTPCRQGEGTILTESLPWHTQYGGFTGTLPTIGRIVVNIVGAAFLAAEPIFELVCLARTTAANPSVMTAEIGGTGVINSVSAGGSIPTSCGLNGSLRGTSTSLTVLNETSRITVRLI